MPKYNNPNDAFIDKSGSREASTLTNDEMISKYRIESNRPEPKSERMQILIRPSTKKRLKEISKHTGNSVNEIINTAIENFIENGVAAK